MLRLEKDVVVTIKFVEFQMTKDGVEFLKAKGYVSQKCQTKKETRLTAYNFFSSVKIFGEFDYLRAITERLWNETPEGKGLKLVLNEAYVNNYVINGKLLSELIVIQSNFQTKKYAFEVKKQNRISEYTNAPIKYLKEPDKQPNVIIKEKKVKIYVMKEPKTKKGQQIRIEKEKTKKEEKPVKEAKPKKEKPIDEKVLQNPFETFLKY